MRSFALLLLILTSGPPQQEPLAEVARAARAALQRGDLGALLSGADRIQLHLPRSEPSGPVGAAQAAAALGQVLTGGSVRVRLARFGKVGDGQGYVELRWEVAVPGRRPLRQRVLLGFRLAGARWRLVEIRVS